MVKRAVITILLVLLLTQPGLGQGKALSIDVHDADIYDVIRLLGASADVNLVPDSSMKHDRVTLRLHDVTFSEALRTLAQAFDLQIHREGSVVLIGSSAAMNRRFGFDADSTAIAVLPLRRAKADDVGKQLVDALPAGTVVVPDKRTATIVVTGGAATIARARSLVGALDAPA